jgi:hypothetical protein
VVERSNATLKDILDVFQDRDRRDRIAIFHYAGHANGYELLLEAESGESEASRLQAANAAGLAEFLGQQAGIQLVFLNGCATQQQAQGLLDAQVASVIATSRSIDDRWAMVFASRFYQGLASGAAIRTAFNEAAAAVKTESGGSQRHLYAVQDNACDRLPWDLHIRPGADTAIHWNLPDAADNPLFGLPKPPAQDLPPEPFRHLDWFRRKDAEIFFGREYQIRDLYQRVTDTTTPPLILLYGQSGVGKSSRACCRAWRGITRPSTSGGPAPGRSSRRSWPHSGMVPGVPASAPYGRPTRGTGDGASWCWTSWRKSSPGPPGSTRRSWEHCSTRCGRPSGCRGSIRRASSS